MLVRAACHEDLYWAPYYVLSGFDTSGYQPTIEGITHMIERCRHNGFALVAEHEGAPVGVLGALITPLGWSSQSIISVLALRATEPGAGRLLIRTLLKQARDTFCSHIGVTIENPDPRVDKMMRRFGRFRMLRTYVFENQE